MPEYPEVSTVTKVLSENIIGKSINDINIIYNKIIKNVSDEEFKEKLIGQEIQNIRNFGKFLIISFTNYDLVIHLRMEGKLFYYEIEGDYILKKHDHIVFSLKDFSNNTSFLIYNDVRKFGTFELYEKDKYKDAKNIVKLGYEPLDKKIDLIYLRGKLTNDKKIKQNLLDQTIINGLGNIYVDEILFEASVHPESISRNLSDNDIENIIKSMRVIIKLALDSNGTTIKSFSASDQIKGSYQKYLKVYKRANLPCVKCNTKIEKIKVNGRGTHFCPHCQRKI